MWSTTRSVIKLRIFPAVFSLLLILLSCQFGDEREPDTFSFPKLVDSLKQYDSVHIVLKDPQGKTIDTLFRGQVHSARDLERLEAPHYREGEVLVTIVGFREGKVAYYVDREFDVNRGKVDSLKVFITPGSTIRLEAKELSIPIKKTVAFPAVSISPNNMLEKGLLWASSQDKVIRIESSGIKALSLGNAFVTVCLASDTAKKDTLWVTVTSRPNLPESIRLIPDTLKVAVGGRPGAFYVQPEPASASKLVKLTLANASFAKASQGDMVSGIHVGLTAVRASSIEDEDVYDGAWIQVIDSVPVESVRFLRDSMEVFEGGTLQRIEIEVLPLLASPTLRFQVRESEIAAVVQDSIQGLKEGSTWIVGSSESIPDKMDSLKVTVFSRQKIDSVVVSPDTTRLYLGAPSSTLTANVYPMTAVQRVEWKTSDSLISTVDGNGKASPQAAGRVQITAISRADSTKKDVSILLVKKDTPLLFVGRSDTIVPVGPTIRFNPKAPQEHGEVVRFEWDLDGDGSWDGTSDSLHEVSHVYKQAKQYPARFRVLDTEGNDTVVTKLVKAVVGPIIQILFPANNSYTNQSVIDVVWSVDGVSQPNFLKELLNKPGANLITRSVTDSTGNVYSATLTVYLDTIAPFRPKVSGTTPSNSITPTWTWSSGGNGNGIYKYRLDDDDLAGAKFNTDTDYTHPTNLEEGVHTLYVQERDLAGNWSPTGRFAITVDLTPPSAPVAASGMTRLTNIQKPTWQWISVGNGGIGQYRIKLNNNDLNQGAQLITSTAFTPDTILKEGVHTLYLQERDSAGNWSSTAAVSLQIDLTSPNAPIFDSTPYSPLNSLRPNWTWKSGVDGIGVYRYKLDNSGMELGSDTVTMNSFKPTFDLSEDQHTLYLQQRDSAGNWSSLVSRSFQLAPRKTIGNPGISSGEMDIYRGSMITNHLNDKFVAFQEMGSQPIPVVIKKYFNGSWQTLGNPRTFGKFTWMHALAVNPLGIPYVILEDTARKASVIRYNTDHWESVGPPGFTEGSVGEPTIAISASGIPFVAFRDAFSGNKSTVMKFNGVNWESVGIRGFSSGFTIFHSLAITSSGIPVLACVDNSIEHEAISVRRFRSDLEAWELLGSFPIHSNGNSPVHLAIGKGDTVFLAAVATESGGGEVYKYNGSGWQKVGSSVYALNSGTGINLAIDSQGIPYAAYRDIINGNRITVKTIRNGDWVAVGPMGFSAEAEEGSFTSGYISIGPDGVPHVLFSDASNSKRATVIRASFEQ